MGISRTLLGINIMKYKLPEGFKIERNNNIENTFQYYKISDSREKSNSFTSLCSLIKDCVEYDKRLKTKNSIKLKPGFIIEVSITDPVSYLYYGKEKIASSGIIEELAIIADNTETNLKLMDRLNNGEEVEINA